MLVTGASFTEKEANFRQLERLVASNLLHGSESLCKLLRFLAEHAWENPGTPVKEYQIATEVFGRPVDFDPRLDSTVRVQTGRLRSKLAEYYAGVGAEDPVIVEIPKGSYALTFHGRPPAVSLPAANLAEPPISPAYAINGSAVDVPGAIPRAVTVSLVSLGAALILAVVVIAYLVTMLPPKADLKPAKVSDGLTSFQRFWKGFVDSPEQPLVVFSNAEFVGRPETGMKYYNSGTDSKEPILDHYTGVGEVLGIHELDRVFSLLNHGLRVKRGRLLSLDDAKNNDLIFVGSPSENLSLLEVPTTQDFVFKRLDVPTRKGDLAIVNLHPKASEQQLFYATPAIPLTEDYSLIALVPGMNVTHWVLLLAGTTTIGTQAAVEYVCRAASIDELLRRLNGSSNTDIAPFEAVLRVKVSRGVPVQSQLVALHQR
jgi:hypothetical protein